jgi:hypothetical protein
MAAHEKSGWRARVTNFVRMDKAPAGGSSNEPEEQKKSLMKKIPNVE